MASVMREKYRDSIWFVISTGICLAIAIAFLPIGYFFSSFQDEFGASAVMGMFLILAVLFVLLSAMFSVVASIAATIELYKQRTITSVWGYAPFLGYAALSVAVVIG